MFDRFIHVWCRYIGDVGAWHARSNYPRDEHGVPWPIYGDAQTVTAPAESNVTPLRAQTESRRG